jgi:hypothetical protein
VPALPIGRDLPVGWRALKALAVQAGGNTKAKRDQDAKLTARDKRVARDFAAKVERPRQVSSFQCSLPLPATELLASRPAGRLLTGLGRSGFTGWSLGG